MCYLCNRNRERCFLEIRNAAEIAQLVEHNLAKVGVAGPSPVFRSHILNKNVPRTGLEPARRETHAPETCASTNSATWAFFLT